MKKFEKVLAVFLSTVMAFSMSACNNSEKSAVKDNSVYRKLYSKEVTSMNYLTESGVSSNKICANVVDCLVEYDQYGNIMPSLAESWEHNDDMTEWTFHIRKGVKWVDKNGSAVADVTANDWVSAAVFVNDARNDSDIQYMYNTGAIVRNAQQYYDYTAYLLKAEQLGVSEGKDAVDADGKIVKAVAPVKTEDIGVKAVDDYTLVYTLEQPCPFFLSVLSYTSYMPVYGPFLKEKGSSFGIDNDSILYNGAYILSSFEPQHEHVLTKNQSYWDKGNVLIEKIHEIYNVEGGNIAVRMYQNGEIDCAEISSDLIDSMMKDEATKNIIHRARLDSSFSYFFCFNFDPQFDGIYEPDNWKLAVNNENFRKSIMYGLDRVRALRVSDSSNPENMLNNTITPSNFAAAAGKDYTQYDALKAYTNGDSFDKDKALAARDAAKKELSDAGASFPVKILMPYNPAMTNWGKECQVIEQQLEGLLGNDYIDIIVEAGPETGFLSNVRMSGKYALLKCNWGADYSDPQTWSEPFSDRRKYGFWEKSTDDNTAALYNKYTEMVLSAASIYNDDEKRYTAFAEAEAMLIDHAIAVPYSISGSDDYMICRLNPMEGEYAPYGVALWRYKYKKLYDTSMSMEEFQAAYKNWMKERETVLANKK